MFPLQAITASSTYLRFALNLAAASVLVVLLGWLCAWLCRRRPVPLQHGILVSIVAVMVCSPVLLLTSQAFGWGLFSIEIPEETPRAEVLHETAREPQITANESTSTSDGRPDGTASAAETPVSFARDEGRVQIDRSVRSGVPFWVTVGYFAIGIWGLGIVVGLLLHAHGLIAIRRFRRSLGAEARSELSDMLQSVLGPEAGRRHISVFVSPLTSAPISLGLFRPIIVVPEYLATVKSRPLRLVLRHEAAHIVRGDHWVALLQQWTAIAFWWNPLVHLVNRRLRHLRELICDDHAAENHTDGRLLAETLVGVAERSVTPHLWGASGLVEDEARSLETRVRRLLERSSGVATRMNAFDRSVATAFAMLLASLLVAGHIRAASATKPEVSIQIVRENGIPAGNVPVVPASIGYNGSFLEQSGFLRTGDAGTLNVFGGVEYMARPEFDAPVVFRPALGEEQMQVTLPRAPIWSRHVPRALRPEQLDISVAAEDPEGSQLLTVTVTNNSGFSLILTEADLSIFSDRWRVFPPETERRGGMIVRSRGGTATLHLDWESYVRSGLWCPRAAADKDGTESDVRISIAGVNSAPFPIAPPENVLARERSRQSADQHEFAGHWLLTLPAGFEHRVKLTPLGHNRYRLTPQKLNMSGIYTVRGGQLRMLEPNDSRLTEFKWQVQNRNALLLVEEPQARKTGTRYAGATLTRQLERSQNRLLKTNDRGRQP